MFYMVNTARRTKLSVEVWVFEKLSIRPYMFYMVSSP